MLPRLQNIPLLAFQMPMMQVVLVNRENGVHTFTNGSKGIHGSPAAPGTDLCLVIAQQAAQLTCCREM
jgi:hypothetical protein